MATFEKPITARLGTQNSGLTPGPTGLGYTIFTWNGTAYVVQGSRTTTGIVEVVAGSGIYAAPPMAWDDSWLGYIVWDNNGTAVGFDDFWPLSLWGGRLLALAGAFTRGTLDEALTLTLAHVGNDETRSGNVVSLKDAASTTAAQLAYDNIDTPSTRTRL